MKTSIIILAISIWLIFTCVSIFLITDYNDKIKTKDIMEIEMTQISCQYQCYTKIALKDNKRDCFQICETKQWTKPTN